MGFSFANNLPCTVLLARAKYTLILTVTAMLLAWSIALPLGVWSAERLGRLPDRLLSWGTAVLLVIPDLALALGLLVVAVRSGWFPTGGMASVNFEKLSFVNKLRDLAWHMILPVTALCSPHCRSLFVTCEPPWPRCSTLPLCSPQWDTVSPGEPFSITTRFQPLPIRS